MSSSRCASVEASSFLSAAAAAAAADALDVEDVAGMLDGPASVEGADADAEADAVAACEERRADGIIESAALG